MSRSDQLECAPWLPIALAQDDIRLNPGHDQRSAAWLSRSRGGPGFADAREACYLCFQWADTVLMLFYLGYRLGSKVLSLLAFFIRPSDGYKIAAIPNCDASNL